MPGFGLVSWTTAALSLLSSKLVHPVYFPYPWAPVLHAARISLVFQTLSRRDNANWRRLLWGPYIFGYLVACWGGGVLSHLAMGLPPPQFYSFHPWVNYITVHLVLTAFFNFYPNLLVPKIYDTLLFPLDGLLRAHSVVSAVSLFASPSISNPLSALSQPSPFKNMDTAFGHIVLGILASAAGGITLNTLSLWSEEWRFATPPILKASLWGSADVWGGALAAIVYSSSIHSSAFQIPSLDSLTAAHFPLTVIPKFILRIFFKPSVGGFGAGLNQVSRFSIPFIYSLFGLANTKTSFVEADSEKPPTPQTTAVPMGQVEAKALAAIILITIFGARVLATHWLTSPPKAGRGNKSKKAVTEVSKEAKRK